jgi:hypothetical protein
MQLNNQALKRWLALGCWGLALALVADEAEWNLTGITTQTLQPWQPMPQPSKCTPTQPQARIARSHFAGLIQVPATNSIDPIRQTLGEPYCTLTLGDEVHWLYPAAWNPSTWIIVRV